MTEVFRVTGIETAVRRFGALSRRASKRVVTKSVRAWNGPFLKASRRLAPRKNGIFKRSLTSVVRQYNGAVVGVIGQQANKTINVKRIKSSGGISGRGQVVPIHLVEAPTRPHRISVKHRRSLKFATGGFAKRASHPGTRGTGFLRKASQQAQAEGTRKFTTKFSAETLREVDAVKAIA